MVESVTLNTTFSALNLAVHNLFNILAIYFNWWTWAVRILSRIIKFEKVTHLSPVTGSTLRRVSRSRMVSVGTSIYMTLRKESIEKRDENRRKVDENLATSFPGSFVSPPQREGGRNIIFLWGGETKDPGNEVEKLPPQENYNAAVSRVSPSSDERRRTNARNISLVILPRWEFDSYRLFVIKFSSFISSPTLRNSSFSN